MTRLMEQAIKRLQSIPEGQQDEFAQFVLHQLAEDERWSRTTAEHADKLKGLFDRVLEEGEQRRA